MKIWIDARIINEESERWVFLKSYLKYLEKTDLKNDYVVCNYEEIEFINPNFVSIKVTNKKDVKNVIKKNVTGKWRIKRQGRRLPQEN